MAEDRVKMSALSFLLRGTPAMGPDDNNSTARSITILPMEAIRTLAYTKRRLHQGKRGKPCVYCGGAAPGITMDHVFAETLFDPVPPDALTVPACEPCNQIKAVGDEALHIVITVSDDAMQSPTVMGHIEEIARAIERNQSPIAAAAWNAFRIRRQVDPLQLGGPVPLTFDSTALYTTLKMAVRGLVFKVHGRILPASCPVAVTPLQQSEAP
jgi:hypothetical protein